MVDAGFAPVASSVFGSTQLAGDFYPMVGVAEDYIELYRSADEFGYYLSPYFDGIGVPLRIGTAYLFNFSHRVRLQGFQPYYLARWDFRCV